MRARLCRRRASLSSAVAAALRGRGIPKPAATLAETTAANVFTVAFGQWITDGETRPLVEIEREMMRDMAAITSDGPLTR
jgi:hypothetical protein